LFIELLPLLNIDKFISLQVGHGRDAHKSILIDDVLPANPTWDDTASLISTLDLVITVDTGVAHLAAAMGKPVWLMLHNQGTWHWMAERPGSPWNTRSAWYLSVRIFRQQKANEWGDVIDEVRAALAQDKEMAA
jgi:ADP-heptose:LPS heptosyltransferase